MAEILGPQRFRALAFAGVAALLWAAIEGIGAVMLVGYDPRQVVWTRYAVHLAALVALVGSWRGLGLVRTTRPVLQVGRGLLLPPLAFLAVVAVAPAATLALFWCAPLLALAALIARAWPGRWRWVIALGGWLGTLLIIRPGVGALRPAATPAFGMAGCFALYRVLTRHLRDQGTAVNLFSTAACVLVPLSTASGGPWPGRAALLGVALIGTVAALLARPQRAAVSFATRPAVVGGAVPALTVRPAWYRWLPTTLAGGKR